MNNYLPYLLYIDGAHFFRASNFYYHEHEKASRLRIQGLLEVIEGEVARAANCDRDDLHAIGRYFFRVRQNIDLRTGEPARNNSDFRDMLGGIGVEFCEVGLADVPQQPSRLAESTMVLHAYDNLLLGGAKMLVLLGSEGFYLPLIERAQRRGIPVVQLYWDCAMKKDMAYNSALSAAARFPVEMQARMQALEDDPITANLFYLPRSQECEGRAELSADQVADEPVVGTSLPQVGTVERESSILSLKNGFGFILEEDGNNRFFHNSALVDCTFEELMVGAPVRYTCIINDGRAQAVRVTLIRNQEEVQ